jgi:hypothetical protein
MSEAVELYNRIQDPIAAAAALGKPFAVMFGLSNEAQGTFIALASMAERKSPFDILRTYHVIDGKLSKKALVIAAEFRRAGGKIKWLNTGKDGKKAEASFSFEGETIVESFTIEEAKQQGLNFKPFSNWSKTPANMLRARVITNAVGMLAPEIVAGVSGGPEDDNEPAVNGELPPEKPAKATKEPKPAKVTEVTTVETQNEATQQPESETTTPEPQAAATAPAPAAAAVDPRTGKLSLQTTTAIETALMGALNGQEPPNILKALEIKQWIPPMGGLQNLTRDRAQKILNNPKGFLDMIEATLKTAKA